MQKINLSCLFNINELVRVEFSDVNIMEEGTKKTTKKEKEKERRLFVQNKKQSLGLV